MDNAPGCVHQPEGLLKYKYVTPTCDIRAGGDDLSPVPERSLTGHYLQMYDWDACFFAQAAGRIGLSDLPLSVVANFLSLSDGSGHLPRTVSPNRVWDSGDACKPFLCQTLDLAGDSLLCNQDTVRLIADLEHFLRYWQSHRRHASGLYHWRNVLESGVDDNLALLFPQEAAVDENKETDKFPDGKLLAADLNTYLAVEYQAFSRLAARAGQKDLSLEYERRSAELIGLIESELWDEKLGMYANLDPDSLVRVALRSWTGLLPVLLGIAQPSRSEQTIKQNVLNAEHFFRHSGLASFAASEPLYNQSCRGLYGRVIVSNWQGPVWVLPNVLAVRCLLRQGFKAMAQELALRVTSTLVSGLTSHGTLFENYNAETGEPLFAPRFMSWNILALELIELLE